MRRKNMDQKRVTGERGYKFWLILGDTVFRKYYRECVTSLNLKGNETVMDFGCGPGLVSRYFAEKLVQGHLTCVDVSGPAIRLSKNRLKAYSNVDFVLGDIREAGLAAGSYDVIFLNFVYFHIDASHRSEIIGKIVELLHGSGRLVIRNAVGRHSGISAEQIERDLAQFGLNEICGEMTRSLFIIPTYFGIFGRAANRVAGGFSPPAPTTPRMRVRTGRFTKLTGP
jgi:SAM-dependent methyltransferase